MWLVHLQIGDAVDNQDRDQKILVVEDLVKNFPVRGSTDVVHAVNHISVDMKVGETLGLVGESGSGKTTTGRCIIRLIDPSAGKISFLGKKISDMSQKEFRDLRYRMQMVFQEPYDSLNPRRTIRQIVEENIYLNEKLSKEERKVRVDEIMVLVGLDPTEYCDRYPHELTGGEQQRVGIARAISTKPDLIVLDEITSMLDIAVRGEIVNLLKKLQNEVGTAYLFISHDLTAVKEISDRVAIMYLGEIVEIGPSPEIFDNQIHPYGQALMSSVLYPDPEMEFGKVKLSGEIPSPRNPPKGCFLHPRCPFVIDKCRTEHPALEQITGLNGPTINTNRYAACWRAQEFI